MVQEYIKREVEGARSAGLTHTLGTDPTPPAKRVMVTFDFKPYEAKFHKDELLLHPLRLLN